MFEANIERVFGVTVLWEIVVVVDMGIGQPGGGFCGRVGALEGDLEVFDKVGEGSKGGGI